MGELALKPRKLGLKGLLLTFHFIDSLSFFFFFHSCPNKILAQLEKVFQNQEKSRQILWLLLVWDPFLLTPALPLYGFLQKPFFWQGSKPGEAVGSRHCCPGALLALGIQREKNGEMFLIEMVDRQTDWNILHCFYIKLPVFHWFKC